MSSRSPPFAWKSWWLAVPDKIPVKGSIVRPEEVGKPDSSEFLAKKFVVKTLGFDGSVHVLLWVASVYLLFLCISRSLT